MPLEFWGLFLNYLHVSSTLINNPGEATLKHLFIRMTSLPSALNNAPVFRFTAAPKDLFFK